MKKQEALHEKIESMRDQSNQRHEDHSAALKEQNSELKEQLRMQQEFFAAQMRDMMSLIKEQKAGNVVGSPI